MLLTVHALTGMALGSLVGEVPGKEVIAFAVGLASHYVLDAIPHWERLYRPPQEAKWDFSDPAKKWPRHIFVQAALDVILAFSLVTLFTATGSRDLAVLFGGVGATVPDLLDNVPFWRYQLRRLSFFKKGYDFHTSMHISRENQEKFRSLGLVTQAAMIGVALWVLL